ncbi:MULTISPECIES: hypothetical protein [Nocardia]|uniref:hypothetical protein n=1 Tax=Nocardia TaxID=1817 RepID=UPI002458E63E|nr:MULTISPECIES: hypothetical protein [Nocardia]
MNDDRHAAIRMLQPPRPVRLDPRRAWVMPAREPERVMPVTLGEKAFSFDLRLGEEWIPAIAYRWARFNIGTTPMWFAEIEVQVMTKNGVSGTSLRQWVPFDAVQPA